MAPNKPDHESRIKGLETWQEAMKPILESIKVIRRVGYAVLVAVIIKIVIDYVLPFLLPK